MEQFNEICYQRNVKQYNYIILSIFMLEWILLKKGGFCEIDETSHLNLLFEEQETVEVKRGEYR